MTKAKVSPSTHTLYIRKFPKDLSRIIKSRAALAGMTIPAYLAQFLTQSFRDGK